MKVTTDSCFFGAWVAKEMHSAQIKNVLDIGCGTGLLSLMVAQKNDVEIDAVEIDKEAALQAKQNIESSPWKNRIKVFNQDILNFQSDKKYDCIISNPPFYENELTPESHRKKIAHHSEQLTILQVIETINTQLKEGGLFFLLLPYKREQQAARLLLQNKLQLSDTVVLCQSVTHSPFRVILKGSNKKNERKRTIRMSICDEDKKYTEPFIAVLKDYYLYL